MKFKGWRVVGLRCGARESAQRISSLSTAPARAGRALRTEWRYGQQSHFGVRQYPMWDAASVALLTNLWAKGHSAGQIATRLEGSRNAVCAKLLRMGFK